MNRKIVSRLIFLFILLLCLAEIAYFGPKLPDTVASHFDAKGQPDGWSSRTSFLIVYGAGILGIILCFVGPFWLIQKLPVSLVNIPNKDYWLAPERKKETMAYLSEQLLLLGSATLLLVFLLFHFVIQANLEEEVQSIGSLPMVLIGLYLAYTLYWTIALIWRFRRREG